MTLAEHQAKIWRKLVDGARNYAAADKSDPFAFARAMTPVNNGIAQIAIGEHGEKPLCYEAEQFAETRSYEMDGRTVEYTVPAYKNIARP